MFTGYRSFLKKIKHLGLIMLCLLTLPLRFGFSEEAVNPIDWNSISPTDIKMGELTPLPEMTSLRYKIACTLLPVRHCAANVELEWQLSNGTKKTQAVMGDGEIVDSIQS